MHRGATPDHRDASARLAPGREAPASSSTAPGAACRHPGASSTSGSTSSTTPQQLIEQGRGPYFYLPKLESHQRGPALGRHLRLRAGRTSASAHGTIRATVLIETISAAFEMDEILYELRDHCAGLNAGRWDYIFTIIKNFRGRGSWCVLPDRKQITMTVPFMRAYTELLVQHLPQARRARDRRHERVHPEPARPRGDRAGARAGARRQAPRGRRRIRRHLGRASRPRSATARAEFDAVLGDRAEPAGPAARRRARDARPAARHPRRSAATVTEAGVRGNISIGVRYIESWLRGVGAAAIDNLMEDAATAEIRRSQIWQWMHGTARDRGRHAHHRDVVEGIMPTRVAVPALRGRPVRRRDRGVPRRGAAGGVPDVPHPVGVCALPRGGCRPGSEAGVPDGVAAARPDNRA